MHDGRVSPTLIRRFLEQDAADENTDVSEDNVVSRQYINQRMKRLAEHEHIENLLDTGVYELREDPREESKQDE
ncbi:hypothetical protein [Natrinema halophilum]|nr:hypothetical protein [Natrinema halophilum]QLG49659.2 hypothetical protein HYG82_12695 [Natrinema halophilum]